MIFAGSDILPPNSTTLEQIVADLDWARIDALNTEVVRQVVNPQTCPEALLPWLAWAMSVDVWDDTWPLATRRAVIAAQPAVQRRKGTRLAIRMALQALGVDAQITEWWEHVPPRRRGTFEITLWITGFSGIPVTAALIQQVRQSVMQAKRKSIAFTIDIGAQLNGTAYAAASQQNVLKIAIAPGP